MNQKAFNESHPSWVERKIKEEGWDLDGPERVQKYREVQEAKRRELLEDEDHSLDYLAQQMARDFRKIGKTEIDRYATQDKIEEEIKKNGLESEYDKWAINKVRPIQSTPYIPKGAKKLPYTMENIMKVITGGGVKGTEQSGAIHGTGFARAKGAFQFPNLNSIRSFQGSLMSSDEFSIAKEKMSDRFGQLANKLERYYTGGSTWHLMDNLLEAIGESYKRGRSLRSELSKSLFKGVPKHLVDEVAQYASDLRNMGSEYFEAKPQRVVGIQEFHGAVVPSDAKPETLEILKRHGLTIEPYDRNVPGDRLRAQNKLADEQDLKLSESELHLEPLKK